MSGCDHAKCLRDDCVLCCYCGDVLDSARWDQLIEVGSIWVRRDDPGVTAIVESVELVDQFAQPIVRAAYIDHPKLGGCKLKRSSFLARFDKEVVH